MVFADGAGASRHDRVRSLESVLGAEDCAHAAGADIQRGNPRWYVRLHPATRRQNGQRAKATGGDQATVLCTHTQKVVPFLRIQGAESDPPLTSAGICAAIRRHGPAGPSETNSGSSPVFVA